MILFPGLAILLNGQ